MFCRSSQVNALVCAKSLRPVRCWASPVQTAEQTLTISERVSLWLELHGGMMHKDLHICEVKNKGLGIIAKRDLAAESSPLLEIPPELCISASTSRAALAKMHIDLADLGEDVEVVATRMNGALEMACFLAHERCLGDSSKWLPYISCLPVHPPCAWLMEENTLEAQLIAIDVRDRDAYNLCLYVGQLHLAVAEKIAKGFPQLKLAPDDIMWALGQVTSRAKILPSKELTLVPLIDCINHAIDGPTPVPSGANAASGFSLFAELYESPLQAGDELYISYANLQSLDGLEKSQQALTCFMAYGFVPPELK